MPSYSVSKHATKSRNILRLTKAAVSEPSPSMQHLLGPVFPLTGHSLLSQVSGDAGKTGLMASVGEGELTGAWTPSLAGGVHGVRPRCWGPFQTLRCCLKTNKIED